MPSSGIMAALAVLNLKDSESDVQAHQGAERETWAVLSRFGVDPGLVRDLVATLLITGRIIGERQAKSRDLKRYIEAIDSLAEKCAKVNQDGNMRALGLDKVC